MIGIALRVRLPESPRWLVGRGRLQEADAVVSDMERIASKHEPLAPVPDNVSVDRPERSRAPFAELFGNRVYALRVLQLLSVWFLAYVTVFAFAAGFTTFLTSLKYPPPQAGLIVAVGAFGFLACAVFAAGFAERLERKLWLPVGAAITLIGGVIVAEAGDSRTVAFIGAAVVFFGFNVWVPMTYTLSTESFPTRARATGGRCFPRGGFRARPIQHHRPRSSVRGTVSLISGGRVGSRRRGKKPIVRPKDAVTITPYRDGPLLVRGPIRLVAQDGMQIVSDRDPVALCRCGKSRIKPFCDGTHKLVGFRAPAAGG